MRRVAAAALVALLAVGAAGCAGSASDGAGSDTVDPQAPATGAPGTDPSVTTTTRPAPTECAAEVDGLDGESGEPTDVALPEVPPTGAVQVTVLRPGDGPEVTEQSYVTVDYLGIACSSGFVFDSSWPRGEPLSAALGSASPVPGASSVIPGWTAGLVGQRQGSLVQIDIPPSLAYGDQGIPNLIDGNEPLTFVIDLLEVGDTPPS